MTCSEVLQSISSEVWFVFAWGVFTPFLTSLLTALYYKHRYDWGIDNQLYFEGKKPNEILPRRD